MSSFVFMSFHRLSFCIHFLSCSFHFACMSFHFAFISFHFALMFFHVPSLSIKDTGLRKLICSNRSGGYPPKRSRVWTFYDLFYRWAIVLEACAGCHLQVGFMNMYMYKLVIGFFYSYRFLGRQCIGSVKVQAKLKWNVRGYCTIPYIYIYTYIYIVI